jgi:hypothetical protein
LRQQDLNLRSLAAHERDILHLLPIGTHHVLTNNLLRNSIAFFA